MPMLPIIRLADYKTQLNALLNLHLLTVILVFEHVFRLHRKSNIHLRSEIEMRLFNATKRLCTRT